MKTETVSKTAPPRHPHTKSGDEPSHVWERLVPRLLHPVKLIILEALLWIEEPVSATRLAAMLDDPDYYSGLLSYHLAEMARAGVLVVAHSEQGRGAEELFFDFSSSDESEAASRESFPAGVVR